MLILFTLPIFLILFWLFCALINFGILKLLRIKIPPGAPHKYWIIILGPFANLIVFIFIAELNEPTKPSQSDIIGTYEIDRSFYPGPNADWQNATYELEIAGDAATIRDFRTHKTWSYPIEWAFGYRWGFKDSDKRHHMIANGPTIYRERFDHYYIFQSPLYGDVKFRKKSRGLWKWLAAGIAGLLICKALWPKHRLLRCLNISRFRIRPPSL
ncbi:hypothetical protein V2O64_18520 [Verrucomicrobiaceae bacterium 227]